MPHDAVASNAAFQALADQHQSKGYERTSLVGLKTIYFHDGRPASEFARAAAEALNVDGMILVDVYDMARAPSPEDLSAFTPSMETPLAGVS